MPSFLAALCALMALSGSLPAAANPPGRAVEFRQWVGDMKVSERGPFERIRWFCSDGAVLPPRAYACAARGGGVQHGELGARARELRANGYWIANLLAGVDAAGFADAANFPERLAHLLIEKYLVNVDDGWILRRALYYRGAIQEEDERRAARSLLVEMAGRDHWLGPGFPVLRIAVRMLPHGADSASALKVRQLSAALSDRDGRFTPLRAKIHGAPGAEDAAAVRDYAAGLAQSARSPYLELAEEIDRLYRAAPLGRELERMAEKYTAAPWLQERLRSAAAALKPGASATQRLAASARLLAGLRDALPDIRSHGVRLEMLDLGLRAEREHDRAASELMAAAGGATRLQRLNWLRSSAQAAYGAGLINGRLLGEAERTLGALSVDTVALDGYMDGLTYLGRAPGWGTQALRMHFFESMQKLAELEPLAMLFIQDQLRGSPLLFFSRNLDGLTRDANRLAGVKHRLFGKDIGVGFTALNPGLARGVLQVAADPGDRKSFREDGIYLLPETIADLPPVAGILTGGEGNPLSHVQLLARNLGIPNVTVDDSVIDVLAGHDGEEVVLAVSPSGLVEISAWSGRWQPVFEDAQQAGTVTIEPDLEKLDLDTRRFLSLDELRASDSGRVVGPKAANLGELRAHYPDKVSRGVALPFGLFKEHVLDQAYPGGEGTLLEWMVREYRALAKLPPGSAERAESTEAFRARLHRYVLDQKPDAAFRAALETALANVFGDELPGLFVRSDTNVEDLAGFTGAGLNLTLPNVVGVDRLLAGIVEVWASPFAPRAFAWRQSHMSAPEHVYSSILLLESVASEKSGVLVTQDIDNGNRAMISVAVNEGLGGAVDGQAAESLRVPLDGSTMRVLATATAPRQRLPDPVGGLQFRPASGSDRVLLPDEVGQLVELARNLHDTFPHIVDDEGRAAPADVEFGFVDGQLHLFQVRPFLESKAARRIGYLQQMETRLAETGEVVVDMNGVPSS